MNEQIGPQRRHALRGYKLIDERDARLPLTVREVFFNFSVYESIKVLDGIPIFLADHLERLFESADRLGMIHGFKEELLIGAIDRLIAIDSLRDVSLRIQLVGGAHPYLFVFSQELPRYPDSYYADGIAVISYEGERVEPEVKSNCLLLNYLALRKAQQQGAFEAVLINREGIAMEGTRSNVFGIRDDTIYTPGKGVLAGVTRKYIIQAAEELGMSVSFSTTALHDIQNGFFHEYFISSTSMGAMPVASIDGIPIGSQFTKTRALHDAVRRREAAYIASHLS